MSRLRWALGAFLVTLSLLSSVAALRTYIVHELWLGGVAVVVLAIIAIVGFASLARARWRLSRELQALQQDPPAGDWFSARRQQLESLHAKGAKPDLDVLSQATAAVELGQAYLGKYLVAVTVLVGLVGTFAGLMETLRGVAPLLADEHVTTLKALAAPLAGLDVTFGASLVGILVTLALALVQGDLALAEEAALTRLEERTRHVIVPSLWPASESADERSVRELAALRSELSVFIQRTAEATSERVAHVAQVEVDRLVKSLQESLNGTVQTTASRVEHGLLSLAAVVESKLGPVLAEQKDQLQALQRSADHAATAAVEASTQAASHIHQATREAVGSLQSSTQAVQQTQAQLLSAAAMAQDHLTEAVHSASARLHTTLQALAEQQREHTAHVQSTHAADQQRVAQHHTELLAHSEQALATLRESHETHARTLQTQQQHVAAQIEKALLDTQRAQSTHAADLQHVHADQLTKLHADHAARLSQLHQALSEQLVALQTVWTTQAAQLQSEQAQHVQQLQSAQTTHAQQLQSAQTTHVQQLQSSQSTHVQQLQSSHAEHVAQLHDQQQQVAARIEHALQALHAQHAAQLTATTQTLCHALQQTLGQEGTRLGEAASALHTATHDLAAAAAGIASPLQVLAPELQALSREVALLAARSDGEEGNATLSELLRLGEGIERLEALLRMSQSVAEHLAPAATPSSRADDDQDPGQVA